MIFNNYYRPCKTMNRDTAIFPNWDAPKKIRAMTTTRAIDINTTVLPPSANVSTTPSANVSTTPSANAPRLVRGVHGSRGRAAGRRGNPLSWLKQVHGNTLVELTQIDGSEPEADGSYTRQPGVICVVKTADCLPVLLTSRDASFVAALHCGWKGLHLELIAKAAQVAGDPSELIAWIGPGISQANYEVDAAFYARFCDLDPSYAAAFQARGDKYLANLPWIAEYQLKQAGVPAVFQSGICSFDAAEQCHSFRRDAEKSGRMATLIWIEPV
jgi:hypothetical protein